MEDIEVSVTFREGLTRLFTGRAKLGQVSLEFEGIVFPSVGGPNINARFTEEALKLLNDMGFSDLEVERLLEQLNLAILNGEARMVDEVGE
ncbi:MAG: hypothetical protein QW756_03995 [Nitrososphaerota archaeon]